MICQQFHYDIEDKYVDFIFYELISHFDISKMSAVKLTFDISLEISF